MNINAAKLDRVMRGVRVAIGLGLLSITVIGPQTPWGYLGIVPLAAGLTGACPVSRLFGRKVCPTCASPDAARPA
jgi:hypothetical protein